MLRPTLIAAAAMLAGGLSAQAQDTPMTFFITSAGPGDGGNLGGLEGADAHCQALAEAAGSTGLTWRAYLSTEAEDARDRIGSGPWHSANGSLIASSVDELHDEANAISKATALDESGATVNGRGDEPNRHDILTGSNADGTHSGLTCEGWTSNGEATATVGHHDRMGRDDTPEAKSWNTSHESRGCSQDALAESGGAGLFYCFAAN
jgi:hypothetical protein